MLGDDGFKQNDIKSEVRRRHGIGDESFAYNEGSREVSRSSLV